MGGKFFLLSIISTYYINLFNRTFTLADPKDKGVGALTLGPGLLGSFVPESGFLPYNEICYNEKSWTRYWQPEQEVPYAVKGNQWVGYDDLQSLEVKMNYILANDLGGAMFWSVETDDFSK
jgi:chitinase